MSSSIARSAVSAARASARPVVAPAARLATQQQRFASNAVQDPKERAASLIDSLPGNSVVSKTLYITLGTGATAYALTNEIFIVNAEALLLAAGGLTAVYGLSAMRKPYQNWADGVVDKIKSVLNSAREEHTSAVRTRIDSVGDLKDVVDLTKQLFDVSRETAKLEHESFALRQKVALASEIKSTLDSWVRFEAQQREDEQRQLVQGVIDKVSKELSNPQLQKDIVASAVSEIESLVKAKKI